MDEKVLVGPSRSVDVIYDSLFYRFCLFVCLWGSQLIYHYLGFIVLVGTNYFLRFIFDILIVANLICRYVCLYVFICFQCRCPQSPEVSDLVEQQIHLTT